MKNENNIDDNDFGFSFADEPLAPLIPEKVIVVDQEKIDDLQNRLNLLHSSIVPFLDNLCKNPEKSTILWPNRVEKIEAYKKKLKNIVEGKTQ
jgi:hypothetical protein